MDIIEKTKELGEMIRSSNEMARLKAAEDIQNNDETAQNLLKEYNLKRINISRDMQNGKISKEEAMKKAQNDFDELSKNEVISAYIAAKREFDAMVQKINDVLNFYITGHDSSCGHDCGSCGGCH
ncbi:MAG: YlbF family regulator [Clostridia bacterium]|nr:YlbF family regulator [Clostridia bacterium]